MLGRPDDEDFSYTAQVAFELAIKSTVAIPTWAKKTNMIYSI